MIEIELYILSSIRIVLQAISCGIFTLIWKYLNKKALGMQSLIDVMIKDYIRIIVANFIISDLTTIKIQDKYHSYLALTLLNIDHFMVVAMLAQILLTTVIRFMIIFHQSAFSNVCDDTIIAITRLTCGSVAFVSTTFGKGVRFILGKLNLPSRPHFLTEIGSFEFRATLSVGECFDFACFENAKSVLKGPN